MKRSGAARNKGVVHMQRTEPRGVRDSGRPGEPSNGMKVGCASREWWHRAFSDPQHRTANDRERSLGGGFRAALFSTDARLGLRTTSREEGPKDRAFHSRFCAQEVQLRNGAATLRERWYLDIGHSLTFVGLCWGCGRTAIFIIGGNRLPVMERSVLVIHGTFAERSPSVLWRYTLSQKQVWLDIGARRWPRS
jgi:hypothetical protein